MDLHNGGVASQLILITSSQMEYISDKVMTNLKQKIQRITSIQIENQLEKSDLLVSHPAGTMLEHLLTTLYIILCYSYCMVYTVYGIQYTV